WILDDITPLRQMTNELTTKPAILYIPQTTYRVRWNMNTDTPLPQEEPGGQNPPDGAILDYFLKTKSDELTLEIRDSKNNLVRRYNSGDSLYKIPPNNVPPYWIRPQETVSVDPGSHRFV